MFAYEFIPENKNLFAGYPRVNISLSNYETICKLDRQAQKLSEEVGAYYDPKLKKQVTYIKEAYKENKKLNYHALEKVMTELEYVC